MQKHDKKEPLGKALEQRNHSENHCSKTISPFASQRYIWFFVLSIVMLIGIGWFAWSSFKQLDKFESQRDEMAELRGTILHFDEVLTMSARMAASTGDLIWEKRYLKYESQLDDAIQRLKIISRNTIKYKFAEKTDTANVELVALEKQAFKLIREDNRESAFHLLNSQKYKELKLSYAKGMTSLTVALQSSAKETHDKLHSRIIIAVLLAAIIVLLLAFGWISLIRINKNVTRYEELELFSSEPGKNKLFNRAAIICSIGAVFVAVLGLLGWIPSLGFLGNISPHFIPMAPTTSICFILFGLIVLIQIRYQLRGWSRFSAVAVTLLLSVFGIIEFAEYFTGIDVEEFFIPDAGMLGVMRKARMSPATGATFFLSGASTLLVLLGETKKKQIKRTCSCAGIVGSFVTITGVTVLMSYLYGNPLLYGRATIPMAATTAIGFIFLGVGLVTAAGPDHMPIRLLVGRSSRAKLLRVFLPLSILIVLSQDILHRFTFTSFHVNSALLSVLSLVFFVAITGIIVTVMAGVIGRALDVAEKKIRALSKFPSEDPNPVLRITKDGIVLYTNEAGKLLLAEWEAELGTKVPERWCNLIVESFASEKGTEEEEEEEEVKDRIFSITIAPVKEAGYANLYARDITVRKQILLKMNERIKEINCLYSVTNSTSQRKTIDEIFLDVAGIIPAGWQYPETTCSRIIFDGAEYISKPFKETEWKQISDIIIRDHTCGSVEVYYMEQHPVLDEGPFLNEERNLINNIAHTLSEAVARKQAEEDKSRLLKIIAESPDYIGVADMQGNLLYHNQAAKKMVGLPKDDDLAHMKIRDMHPDWAAKLVEEEGVPTAIREGIWQSENTLLHRNGSKIPVSQVLVVHRDLSGEPKFISTIMRDITDRKNFENELKNAKEDVEQVNIHLKSAIERAHLMAQEATVANQAKSEFLANMSHEIRTPMNAIIGFSDILAQEELNLEQMEYVNTIINSSKHLLTVINDILDFSKIESGKLNTEIIECSLEKLLDNISFMMQPKATEKGLDFKVLHKTELPAQIRTDSTRLYQCLTNLIGNAIKFTEKGHVHVIVSLEEIEDKPIVRFDVEDTGIGIPTNKQNTIFESFSQADGSTTRKFGGTGLGLTITKRLAEILGGSITVQSEPGQGSVFSLFIPAGLDVESQPLLGEANMREYSQESPQTAEQKYTGNILIAEDDPANQKLIEILLKKMGLQVTLVDDGKQAVDAATSQSFDLIFMDMQMPVMNGYEATEALRKEGLTVPIVALTANALRKDEQKCLDAGCDGYLAKPVDRKKLSEMLGKYLCSDSSEAPHQSSDQLPQTTKQPANSPIISELADNPDLREVIEIFINDLPRKIQKIVDAVNDADLDQLKFLIHKLKGSSGNAGYPILMQKAAEMEQLVNNQQTDSFKNQMDELTQLCQRATINTKEIVEDVRP